MISHTSVPNTSCQRMSGTISTAPDSRPSQAARRARTSSSAQPSRAALSGPSHHRPYGGSARSWASPEPAAGAAHSRVFRPGRRRRLRVAEAAGSSPASPVSGRAPWATTFDSLSTGCHRPALSGAVWGDAEKARGTLRTESVSSAASAETVVYWMFGPFPGPTPRPVAAPRSLPGPRPHLVRGAAADGASPGPLNRSVQCWTGSLDYPDSRVSAATPGARVVAGRTGSVRRPGRSGPARADGRARRPESDNRRQANSTHRFHATRGTGWEPEVNGADADPRAGRPRDRNQIEIASAIDRSRPMLFDVIDTTRRIDRRSIRYGHGSWSLMAKIALKGVDKVYSGGGKGSGGVKAVDNLDLEIADGEFMVLVG